MSSPRHASVVDFHRYDAVHVNEVADQIARLYRTVYQEPPYCEGANDVAAFVEGMPRRAAQPAFRLVLATINGESVGFAFGHQLTAETHWWQGATTPFPVSITQEWPGRTFAIIELAVVAQHRRHGIARALHQALLVDGDEERVTLLVRPEALPAQAAYERWGYQRVGAIKPAPDSPVYDAMVLNLHQ